MDNSIIPKSMGQFVVMVIIFEPIFRNVYAVIPPSYILHLIKFGQHVSDVFEFERVDQRRRRTAGVGPNFLFKMAYCIFGLPFWYDFFKGPILVLSICLSIY